MTWKTGVGRLLSAGVTAILLAACSVAEPPVAPTQLTPFDGFASNGFDGAVFACKAGGPAGTYSFHVEKSGGGSSWYPYGQDATLTFDGTNMVCAHMWSPLDVTTWGPGVTGTVTVTETALPAGVEVDFIQVWDSRNQVFLSPNVVGSNSVTIKVDVTNNLYYAKFYNKTSPPPPPPPPVAANCVSITAVQGLAITPVTLTGSGGTGGPYTFSATGLPAGVTLSSSGTYSGTPTVSGTFAVTITVTDKDGNTGTVHCGVTVQPPPPPPPGGEGCTPGYWKQSQHFDSWASGILTTQKIGMYFPAAALYSLNGKTLDQYTLLEGLKFQGGSTPSGKAETLIRAGIAALLNSGAQNYGYTNAEVLALVNAALNSNDATAMNTLAGKLDVANNAGCTLN